MRRVEKSTILSELRALQVLARQFDAGVYEYYVLKYLRSKQQTQGVKYSKQIAPSKCLCCKIKQERLHQYCCPRQVATLIRMAGLFVQLASKFGRLIKYGQANTPC